MNYWHLQMYLPKGKGGIQIDSKKMLLEPQPIIGTGEWEDEQCENFKDSNSTGLKINDIILIREGQTIIALCRIISKPFQNTVLTTKYININFRYVEVLEFYNGSQYFPMKQGTLNRLVTPDTSSYKFISNWLKVLNLNRQMESIINILNYKKQIILQGPPGTGKTYTAKDLAEKLIFGEISKDKNFQKDKLDNSEQFKLIQFHPSYSYEDFVRGIIAKTNDSGLIEYKAVNKVLGEFARIANENYNKSSPINTIKEYLNHVKNEIKKTGVYHLDARKNGAMIKDINENNILYDHTEYGSYKYNLNLTHFYDYCLKQRVKNWNKEIWEDSDFDNFFENKFEHSGKVGIPLMKNFWEFQDEYLSQNERLNYILIIDEINRANLPSVLGELIYALEYRGESVESMYGISIKGEINKYDNKITLPPNLHIIGTMNTADRSVGHIDYAIRRRFAFIDVLPTNEPIGEAGLEAFKKVSSLFIKNYDTLDWSNPKLEASEYLATDFRPEDIWLGHSYFITKEDISKANGMTEEELLKMKLKFEIVPILKEYVKDGILLESEKVKKIIDELVS